MKWQLLSSGAQSSREREKRERKGELLWEGEGVPTLVLSFYSSKKEGGAKGEGSDSPFTKRSQFCTSQVVTDSAEDRHYFLSARPALPASGDRRQQDIQPPIPGWGCWCISQNHLSRHPSPQRTGGGLAAPSPTSSPKAQAPWQRPRRQGGVCQRHLSLTSSITGHHGNTHDSTQEGLPVQPSLCPSLHQGLS